MSDFTKLPRIGTRKWVEFEADSLDYALNHSHAWYDTEELRRMTAGLVLVRALLALDDACARLARYAHEAWATLDHGQHERLASYLGTAVDDARRAALPIAKDGGDDE